MVTPLRWDGMSVVEYPQTDDGWEWSARPAMAMHTDIHNLALWGLAREQTR